MFLNCPVFLHFRVMIVFKKWIIQGPHDWTVRTHEPSLRKQVICPLGQVADVILKNGLFFDNKDSSVGSFYYSTYKFDRENDEFDRTRRFETSHNCCYEERFQMFITTAFGATSTNFVVKRDLQNFCSTCGSLQKSFWRHDMKNTQPYLKGGPEPSEKLIRKVLVPIGRFHFYFIPVPKQIRPYDPTWYISRTGWSVFRSARR